MNVLLFSECNGIAGFGRDAGAYTIASRLREEGLSVKVVDFFSYFDDKLMTAAIEKWIGPETIMVGFSSTHFTSMLPKQMEEWFLLDDNRTRHISGWNVYFPFSAEQMERWFNEMKRRQPRLKIVVGGQKVARKISLQKKYPGVDYWVAGYADSAIIELSRGLLGSNGAKAKQLFFSERDFASVGGFEESKIGWHEDDLLFSGEAVPLEIARGCNFNCVFCDYPKKQNGEMIKSERVLRDQLLWNFEKFGIKNYMITDSLVNESSIKTEMLWRVFTGLPFKVEWSGFARLDLFGSNPETAHMIRESGARSLQLGIESINAKNNAYKLGKLIDKTKTERALANLREVFAEDVILGSGFIAGLPGDNEEDINELFRWLTETKLLDAYEVCPLFIGSYHPERAATINFSEIQKNPGHFGYKLSEIKQGGHIYEEWENTNTGMTKSRAIALLEKFQCSEAWDRRLIANWVLYSRVRNLGFSHEECLASARNNKGFVKKMIQRHREMAAVYLKRSGLAPA